MTTTTNASAARRPNSDIRLIGGVLVALIVIVVLTLITGPGEDVPLSVHSSYPEGAMALRLWIERSGFEVHEITANPVQMGSEGTLFILDPDTPYTTVEATYLQNWVKSGHTLIVSGTPLVLDELLKPYNVSMQYAFSNNAISLNAPTLTTPPFDNANIRVRYYISTTRTDVVTHASANGSEVIVSFSEGQGQVWVIGAIYPFTNRGIQETANGRLIANLISTLPHDAVGFDEARHGFGTPSSISGWLFNTPPGWSILLALGLTLLYLGLRGRRFGQAVPIPEERLLREPVEYIRAMANLFRRSGQRTEMLKHYRAQFRRRLSERYNIDPRIDDVEMVKTITFRDPATNEAALRNLLADLSRTSISEAQLVTTASETDAWVRDNL